MQSPEGLEDSPFTKIEIKSFECPKSYEIMKRKIMLGTSDTWSMSHSSQQPRKPAYYIEDCRIYSYGWLLISVQIIYVLMLFI